MAGDPLALVEAEQHSEAEARYARAARSLNTRRANRFDWNDFVSHSTRQGVTALPAAPATVSSYLTELADTGAKVGTISRRLSAIRLAHRLQALPDPTAAPWVVMVWEGIRRERAAPPVQATPLMPPLLWEVLEACPSTRSWRTPGRAPEADLAGLRDRALLLVGFWAALRRAELAGLTVADRTEHARGMVLRLPRSKTNQRGEDEMVVLPHTSRPERCPVTALRAWLAAAQITDGPLLRPVSKGNRVLDRPLHPESVNTLVQLAIQRADLRDPKDPDRPFPGSAHSLRAGFVTYAHLKGVSDRAIAHQTRHRSLASIGTYVRVESAWINNAATQLGE
jgi:integrase